MPGIVPQFEKSGQKKKKKNSRINEKGTNIPLQKYV